MHQHSAERAVADKQEALLPSGDLLFLDSHTVGRSSWKPTVLPKRIEQFLVGNVTSLFIYFIYLLHSSHKLDFPKSYKLPAKDTEHLAFFSK